MPVGDGAGTQPQHPRKKALAGLFLLMGAGQLLPRCILCRARQFASQIEFLHLGQARRPCMPQETICTGVHGPLMLGGWLCMPHGPNRASQAKARGGRKNGPDLGPFSLVPGCLSGEVKLRRSELGDVGAVPSHVLQMGREGRDGGLWIGLGGVEVGEQLQGCAEAIV